jgi:WD40 repeat protein
MTTSSAAEGDVIFTSSDDETDDGEYTDVDSSSTPSKRSMERTGTTEILPNRSFTKTTTDSETKLEAEKNHETKLENPEINHETISVEINQEIISVVNVEEKKEKKEIPELTEEEEMKLLESFVVKNLDTNEVTNLKKVVEAHKNPIYAHLVGVVTDYETTPEGNFLSPTQEDERPLTKGWNNVIKKIKKKVPLTPTSKEIENKYKHKANQKSLKQFSNIKLNQKIEAHSGAIWAMKFTHDGSYLATGGQDGQVIIWKINLKNEKDKDEKPCDHWIEEEPHKKFLSSKNGDILDLDWSKVLVEFF